MITDEYRQAAMRHRNELSKTLKKGDRIGATKCPGTKRVFTFSHFDGYWMVSISGIDDYSPCSIYSINGNKYQIPQYLKEAINGCRK